MLRKVGRVGSLGETVMSSYFTEAILVHSFNGRFLCGDGYEG